GGAAGHLGEGDDPLLHAGPSGAAHCDQRPALARGRLRGPGEGLTGTPSQRAAEKPELHRGDDGGDPADAGPGGYDRLLDAGRQPRHPNPFRIRNSVVELQGVAVVQGDVERVHGSGVGELTDAHPGGDPLVVAASRADTELRLPARVDEPPVAPGAGGRSRRCDPPQLWPGGGEGGAGAADHGTAGGRGSVTHSRAAPAQVAPAPKARQSSRSPGRKRPAASASASARGMDAALVFPNRSPLKTTFSDGTPARFPTASMMRRLAWWGTIQSTSSIVQPASLQRPSASSTIRSTASLKVPLPAMRTAGSGRSPWGLGP